MKSTKNVINNKNAEINAVALFWLEEKRKSKYWDLTLNQVSILLGGVSPETYKSWLKKASIENAVELNVDVIDRLSLLLGIHKAISLSSPQGYERNFWNMGINHPIFQGKSTKEALLEDPSVLTFSVVRKYLEARTL